MPKPAKNVTHATDVNRPSRQSHSSRGSRHEEVAAVFRQMDALRQSLPKSKDKTGLKSLVNKGRRFHRMHLNELQQNKY
jgi:hypothetical protein